MAGDKQFNQTTPLTPKQEMYLHVIDQDDGKDKYVDQLAYEQYMLTTLPEDEDFIDYPGYAYTSVSDSNVVAFQSPSTEAYGNMAISELKKMMIDATYPVGTIYENESDNRNPFEYFGVGTWVAWGQGKSILGIGTGSDINAVNLLVEQGDEGGEYVNTLSDSQIPYHTHPANISPNPHNHTVSLYLPTDTVVQSDKISSGRDTSHDTTATSSTSLSVTVDQQATGGQSHNNITPYVAAYRWRRTA